RRREILGEIPKPQLAEVLVLADEDQWRGLRLVDRRERIPVALEIDEPHFLLVPVLEEQLAFDAGVGCQRHRHRLEDLPVDDDILAEGWNFLHLLLALPGYGELRLRIAQPAARVVREADVPFVPVAELVLVDDSPDDGECILLEASFRAELDAG